MIWRTIRINMLYNLGNPHCLKWIFLRFISLVFPQLVHQSSGKMQVWRSIGPRFESGSVQFLFYFLFRVVRKEKDRQQKNTYDTFDIVVSLTVCHRKNAGRF